MLLAPPAQCADVRAADAVCTVGTWPTRAASTRDITLAWPTPTHGPSFSACCSTPRCAGTALAPSAECSSDLHSLLSDTVCSAADVGITEARVGRRGEGQEPPGTHGAWRRPGVSPGSGLTETATGPGSTLTARGGADSLWLQRFAFLKLQLLDTVELYAVNLCSPI